MLATTRLVSVPTLSCWRCIDRLPQTYRTVLLLRDIKELDIEEAASVLSITTNAVKIRLHRARQALRALLEQELTDAPSQ